MINKEGCLGAELDSKVVESLAHTAAGELSPMAALFGGIVGQEALKAISGKFHPLFQFLYFDSMESLPVHSPSEEDCKPQVIYNVPLLTISLKSSSVAALQVLSFFSHDMLSRKAELQASLREP